MEVVEEKKVVAPLLRTPPLTGAQATEEKRRRAGGLPLIECSVDLFKNPPPLKQVLIEGILRKSHKMLFSGPAKAGKSFGLINLALSLAYGINWLNFQCQKSRVLYINLEIDRASLCKRVEVVAKALGIPPATRNLHLWNLRGFSVSIEQFIPPILQGIDDGQYDVVIIDPLYKLFSSLPAGFEENSASSFTGLFSQLDRVIFECGCSLIFAGHFTKGTAGTKAAIDRTSGSGVLGRDPDAILTLTELAATPGAYRFESVLREFPSTSNLSLRWEYPLHVIDPSLDDERLKGSVGRHQAFDGDDLIQAFKELDTGSGEVEIDAIRQYFGGYGSINTIRNKIRMLEETGRNSFGLYVKGKRVCSKKEAN